LTITIAKKEPATGIHSGTVTGKQKASSIPVTTAEQSLIVFGFLTQKLKSVSKTKLDMTLIDINTSTRTLNK
jgi:hypothetical protein